MTDILLSLSGIRLLDALARGKSPIHRTHPLAKILVTMGFLLAVASTSRREVIGLLPFALYPFLVIAFAELPLAPILHRVIFASPLIIGIGALNPLFDRETVAFGGMMVSGGWLIFASIALKGVLTICAALILIATTGMEGIGESLRTLGLPKVFVLQIQLTYRYLSLLLEELVRIVRAYELRSPFKRRIGKAARGSLPGLLLVRTYERSQRVYAAMLLRGFDGEYRTGDRLSFRLWDAMYIAYWVGYFSLARFVDIPGFLGSSILKAIAG